MLNVSDKAGEALHRALEANEGGGEDVLRLTRSGDQLALAVDQERDGDQIVEHDGRSVLVVEPAISQALDGATLDAVQTPEGLRFVFEAPEK